MRVPFAERASEVLVDHRIAHTYENKKANNERNGRITHLGASYRANRVRVNEPDNNKSSSSGGSSNGTGRGVDDYRSLALLSLFSLSPRCTAGQRRTKHEQRRARGGESLPATAFLFMYINMILRRDAAAAAADALASSLFNLRSTREEDR